MPHVVEADAPDPAQADAMDIAEAVGHLGHLRRHSEGDIAAIAPHDDLHRRAGVETHRLLNILETFDLAAIDLGNRIARLDATLLGGTVGLHLPDIGRRERLADGGEEPGEKDDGEDKVSRRSSRDNGDALAQAFVMEGDRAIVLAHRGKRIGRQRAGIGIAIHLDVAAERYRAQLPPRSGTVVPAEDLRTEADREDLDAHAVAAGDEVMPEFVHEDQHGEDDEKWDDIGQPARKNAHEVQSIALNSTGHAAGAAQATGNLARLLV